MKGKLLLRVLAALILWNEPVSAMEMTFVTESFAPFSMEIADSHKPGGAMVEVVQAVCQLIKASCSIEVYPWRRAYQMAERGDVDGIFSLVRTPEREKVFFLSQDIIKSAHSLFAMSNSSLSYSQPGDLAGLTIGVYGPSAVSMAVEEIIRPIPSAQVALELSNTAVLRKLAAGRYGGSDKVVGAINRDVGLHLMQVQGISGIKYIGDLKSVALAVGLSRKRLTEVQFVQFNEALKLLIQSGKVKHILDKYGIQAAK